MKTRTLIGSVCLCALAGCGLEGLLSNVMHRQHDRPASTITGTVAVAGLRGSDLTAIDGDGKDLAPFSAKLEGGTYELKLPSAKYSMIRVQARAGNFVLRALVPSVGEESAVYGVNLDAAGVAEALIVEARVSGDGKNLKQLTPAAYVGDGVTTGTRTLIRKGFAVDGDPAKGLLDMVTQFLPLANVSSGDLDPSFMRGPVLDPVPSTTTYAVVESPVDPSFLARNPFDYDGDGAVEGDTVDLDRMLVRAAEKYDPSGCKDDRNIRLVFSVNFNAGALNGNCGAIDRFKWAKDAPNKQMFFVGWVHRESEVQDPAINALLGASVPNQIRMYDDGTNGDETAGDNVWTVFFDVPLDPAKKLRVGYKYTWGTQGAPWTGSEEWPGNSRILEVVDVNGDLFVHRRDVFSDEATNKDRSNLNLRGSGVVNWDTVLLGAPAGCVDLAGVPVPEAREQPSTISPASACTCTEWLTPTTIGPLKVACTQ